MLGLLQYRTENHIDGTQLNIMIIGEESTLPTLPLPLSPPSPYFFMRRHTPKLCTCLFYRSGDKVGEGEEEQDEVPERAVHLALKAGEAYLSSKYHDDIENSELHLVSRLLQELILSQKSIMRAQILHTVCS